MVPNPKDVLEHLEEYNKSQVGKKPAHYDAGINVADIQEKVHQNVLNATCEPNIALWAAAAVKHILRAGHKDDVLLELKKAEDYLHKARTGHFITKGDVNGKESNCN